MRMASLRSATAPTLSPTHFTLHTNVVIYGPTSPHTTSITQTTYYPDLGAQTQNVVFGEEIQTKLIGYRDTIVTSNEPDEARDLPLRSY